MTDPDPAKQTIADLLDVLRSAGGLRFNYAIASSDHPDADHQGATTLDVTLSGPDTALLLERNGELLHALESLTAAVLRLTPEQHDQLSFDAEGFKAARADAVRKAAERAVATVRSTGQPFVFEPMNSRERRMLHLALSISGLATASSGIGPRRFVVLYPAGVTPAPERFEPPARPSGRPRNGVRRGSPTPRRSDRSDRRNDRPASPRVEPHTPRELPLSLRPAAAAPVTDEALGNRRDPNNLPPSESDDPAATEARLESIRRAFRKR